MHVPRHEHGALFRSIAQWLRPNGVFLATLGLGDMEFGRADNWHGAAMYWSSFDRATSLRLLRNAGFDVLQACEDTLDEDGILVTFLWVLARKIAMIA